MAKASHINSAEVSQAAEDGKKRKTFFSFGDEGVTATVGSNGRLLRISRHFPGQRTGFCVDAPDMCEPYNVSSRLDETLRWAENPENGGGIGPSIDGKALETIVNNRWPTFNVELKNGRKFKLQYTAFGGTIYQQFRFSNYQKVQQNGVLVDKYSVPEVSVTLDLLIRDLDFVQSQNAFNEALSGDDSYGAYHHGSRLSREHVNDHGNDDKNDKGKIEAGEKRGEKKKGVLSIHVLDEHESFQFVKSDGTRSDESGDVGPFMVQRKSKTTWNGLEDNSSSDSFTVTLAYTLEYGPENSVGIASPPPWEKVSKTMSELLQPFENLSMTNDSNPTLDYFLGRNLEYILSVCSIPIYNMPNEERPCFALTCGDVDGHRVAVAASFNAFQVLLVALKYFRDLHDGLDTCGCRKDSTVVTMGSYVYTMKNRIYGKGLTGATRRSYICHMHDRIDRVCSGHVKWILQRAYHRGSSFCPNYWVNGEEISDWENNYWLPEKALVDAPFQIIKACTYINMVGKAKVPWPESELKSAIKEWVEDLDEINKLGLYAFPRYDDEPTQSFYLADHALIWQAVESAEKLGLAPEFKGPKSTSDSSASRLKRNILKRFTTENPQSKKRMIAVTRTPLQTRFLLRSRDTALFCAMELGLFDKPEKQDSDGSWRHKIDLWKSTIECQKDHEDNDDLTWNDPRRFALSLLMAQIHKSMNLRSPAEMSEHAMCVLLRASSANGLFAGRLHADDRREPILFDDERRRDAYWEVVFEIPYILWKVCLGSDRSWVSDEKPDDQSGPQTENDLVLAELRTISRSSIEISTLLRENQGRTTGARRARAPLDYSMKYAQPFNNMIDEENIVELQDEWLYKEPVFFVRSGSLAQKPGTIDQTGSNPRTKDEAPRSEAQAGSPFIGLVVDVSKSKPSQKIKSDNMNTKQRGVTDKLSEIKDLMGCERTIEGAKKRFWAFFSADASRNEACLSTFFEEEDKWEEMERFFNKHYAYLSFFTEETSAVLNTWTTEIHFAFYRLGTSTRIRKRKAQRNCVADAPSLPGTGKNGPKQPLDKVAMSFHFEGDFFDRYWTCRYLEAGQKEIDQWIVPSDPDSRSLRTEREAKLERLQVKVLRFLENKREDILGKNAWQQRRVLELMLFGRIVQRMNSGASEVLEAAWFTLLGRSQTRDNDRRRISTLSVEPEYDVFLTTEDDFVIPRKRVEQVQRVLRTLIGNLEENIAQIDLWKNREVDRLAERPRWTFHDESRFRVTIQKLLVSNDHDILRLNRVHLQVSKLEDSLVKKLEIIRSDLEEKRGGETQLFTYVTVIFLPLGFATGIFSMSEAPATRTLTNMIYTALGALGAITVIAIAAKVIMRANVVKSLKVPEWTSPDWSSWKAGLRAKWRADNRDVEQGNAVPDDA